MNAIQLEFFPKDPSEILEERMDKCETRSDNVRKGIFAKHTQLCKMYLELNERLNVLEQNLCKKVV